MADSHGFRESEWYAKQVSSRPHLHAGYTLLADGGFALETWLLKPYPEEQLTTPKKRMYNFSVCSPRAVVENAFGVLKGRWRLLHSGVSCETELAPYVVDACVRLHDFLEDQGDEWNEAIDPYHDGAHAAAGDKEDGDA
ncbi:hypothetical protein I4F81_006202 [Pyropia yezoensis]|uniref:Uncharacterized protein n=1 Tax=Pyropia yezoensis TaxID=2788 RepID=A0ACC3C0L2_PYRYE|nr:hypothetical protein I4F81_006202 [Neopyropia yezoensis]